MKDLIMAIFDAVSYVLGKFGISAKTDDEFAWVDWAFGMLFK